MRLWPAVAAVAAISIIACGRAPYQGPVPAASPPRSALVPWSDFPVDQVPRPVVLIGNASVASGFSNNEAKIAALCHKFQSAIKLSTAVPARAQVTWTVGTTATYPAISAAAAFAAMVQAPADATDPSCASAQPLVVNGAHFGAFDFATDRGNAEISAWLFTSPGMIGEAAYPALASSAYRNGGSVSGYVNGGSFLSADGLMLTFKFWGAPATSGPCGAEYQGLVAESSTAVAVAVKAFPHAQPGEPVACDAMAQERVVTLRLQSPLGDRVVVDSTSSAVSVCPDAISRAC